MIKTNDIVAGENRYVVLPHKQAGEKKSAGGIIVPDNVDDALATGDIVADSYGEAKPDERSVVYFRRAGVSVKINGKNHVVIKHDDALLLYAPE